MEMRVKWSRFVNEGFHKCQHGTTLLSSKNTVWRDAASTWHHGFRQICNKNKVDLRVVHGVSCVDCIGEKKAERMCDHAIMIRYAVIRSVPINSVCYCWS